ncbi:MAG: N-acetyltransferase [Eubacterium sp.]|nr:N-acetyltransferase [Eubacterium sp.]
MNIRKASIQDLGQLLSIYAHAREQMRAAGNPGQWKDSYPSSDLVKKDIQNGSSYVVTENGEIFAVFVFMIGDDPTYAIIENGSWLNENPYGTIHRLAADGRKKGIFRCCLSFCEARTDNIRADTHACNRTMQHLLETNGFQKCGRIYVADKSPRIAYQKVVCKTASTP